MSSPIRVTFSSQPISTSCKVTRRFAPQTDKLTSQQVLAILADEVGVEGPEDPEVEEERELTYRLKSQNFRHSDASREDEEMCFSEPLTRQAISKLNS